MDLLLPYGSPTAEQIEARQMRLLKPGRVLEYLMWPSPVDVAMTADFREERHDPLVERLQEELESKLFESPRLFLTQSLQDRGCDLVIDWPQRAKYGVQLKSNGDVTETNFANKTIAQIQDSRQHNLRSNCLVCQGGSCMLCVRHLLQVARAYGVSPWRSGSSTACACRPSGRPSPPSLRPAGARRRL